MLPKINQTMFIQLPRESGTEQASLLRSRLADMDEASLYIEIPLEEKTGRYHRAQPGDEFRVTYYTTEGVKHEFKATVQNFLKEETVPLVELRKPKQEEITREQRRNFLRVEAQLEVAVRIGDKMRFLALTEDVGGGGISLRCERKWPIQPNLRVNCWLLIPFRSGSIAHAQFEGDVIRVAETEPNHYIVMIRFVNIAESDQQKVIRYCFERQLDFRKE
ncbi:flagellar brake domain-containing protein [Cohnella lubricantis]|uniref:Flagellar brake domain-containing protein n=1 Tax=Cohnella lubricantis TaxID=2163172 RepID=A0A841T9U0_9BACL|nr:flagellar brake domain-containing protein [Cohnella lubricantis]MBB6677722.1 flagellar brake domain-containing protein [Cohnella lubricantis]MBP2117684.1 c-di-GMP-binding flagellar brake protein YcgR [Cohnella lubricantis]